MISRLLIASVVSAISTPLIARAQEAPKTEEVRTPLPANAGPDFVPSVTDAIVAAVDISAKSSVTSVTAAPARPVTSQRALWGLQIGLSYDSDKKKPGFSLAYRLDPRWVIPGQRAVVMTRASALSTPFALPAHRFLLLDSREKMQKATAFEIDQVDAGFGVLNELVLRLASSADSVASFADAARTHKSASAAAQAASAIYTLGPNAQGQVDAKLRKSLWEAAKEALGVHIGDVDKALRTYPGARICGPGASPCELGTIGTYNSEDRWKAEQYTPRSLLPALTIGYSLGLLPFDYDAASDAEQDVVGSSTFRTGLSWRLAAYLEVDGTGVIGTAREQVRDDPKTAGVRDNHAVGISSVSASAVVIVPQLLGTTYYDAHYFENGFQRGLGLGFAWSTELCLEPEDGNRQDCPRKGHTEESFYGGVLDFRISKLIRPRLRIGDRVVERFDGTRAHGVDASAFFAFVLDAGG